MSTPDLEDLFATARANPLPPSDALMARVLADALEAQPKPAAPLAMRAAMAPRRGFWSTLAAGFGGSGVLAGLGAAAALGLLVGYVNPAGLGGLADSVLSTSSGALELVPAADIFLTEG